MGFGILFIGYFLILNVTNPGYTDLIAGLVMLMAFYRLSTVNRYFRMSIIPSAVLSVFGALELFAEFADMFGINMTAIEEYLSAPRFVILGVLTVMMLMGIDDVAREVDVDETKKHVRISRPLSYAIFPVCAILEFPAVASLIPSGLAIAIVSTAAIILLFLVVIYNLITIYSAYMRICMPDDVDNAVPEKPSRFGFVNKYREREREKAREYTEYKIDKLKKKAAKRGKK